MKRYLIFLLPALSLLLLLASCNTTSDDANKSERINNMQPVTIDTSTLFRYNGYSSYQSFSPDLTEPTDSLSLFYSIAPASWETTLTGIVSEYAKEDHAGYDLSVGRYRSVVFRCGIGTKTITVETDKNVLNKEEWNTVAVEFRGDLGTITILINGKTAGECSIDTGTKIIPANVKKRIGCNYDKEIIGGGVMLRNVFDGYITEAYVQGDVSFPPAKNLTDEINHPTFHAAPAEKWMNEPHGPFYYNGSYHLFFQSNPHGPYFNNLTWGHWVSKDMVNWSNLPPAIEPEYGTVSPDGCWSGSSVISSDGTPLIFYTAGDDQAKPNQMVAVARPDDLTDPNLVLWTKDAEPIITQDGDTMLFGEFRDPFVFEESGKYWCLVGTGDAATGAGNAAVYLAADDDLTTWEHKGFLMDYDYIPEVGHDWELPVLLPIKGGSEDITHILTVCACRVEVDSPVKTYYWLGTFDNESGTFIPKDKNLRAIDENALSIGGTGFVTPDNRSVLFLIAQGKRSSDADGAAGYAHCAALPLDMWVENDELRIKPIDEVSSLRKKTMLDLNALNEKEANEALGSIDAGEYEISMRLPNEDFTIFIGNKTLAYYKESSSFGFRGDGYSGKAATVNVTDNEITLRIIIDRSVVECFLDEQSYCSTRVYAKDDLARKTSVMIHSTIYSLTVYQL